MSKAPELTLVFDGWCGFCTFSATLIKRLDPDDRLRVTPYQNAQLRLHLGLTLEDCRQAVWAIDSSGRKYRGAGAINAAFATVTNLVWLNRLYQNRFAGAVEDFVYDTVAKYRRHLPGMTPYCQKNPGDCGDIRHRHSTG